MLCEDKGGNRITVHFADFISMLEAAVAVVAAAVEQLQRGNGFWQRWGP